MPISRLRQITTIIQYRLKGRDLRDRAYMSWHMQSLAMIIGATAGIEKKGFDQLKQQIQKMTLLDESEKPINKDEELDSTERAASKNQPGSFERLTRGLV